MGLFRKATSSLTLGAVDFRSAKDRTARKAAKGARAAKRTAKYTKDMSKTMADSARVDGRQIKAQTEIMRQQAATERYAQMQRSAAQQPAASGPPPGFYRSGQGTEERWWDGQRWTEITR